MSIHDKGVAFDTSGATDAENDTTTTDASTPFCAKTDKVSINGIEHPVTKVASPVYIPACCKEAAQIEITAKMGSEDVVLRMFLEVGLGHTITSAPLPQTIDLSAPPPGLKLGIHFSSPPNCRGNCTLSDLVSLEYPSQPFTGNVTFRGTSYDDPLDLQFCLSVTNNMTTTEQVKTAKVFVSSVIVPTWKVGP